MSGGTAADPEAGVSAAELQYEPDDPYVDSALLSAIHDAVEALGTDNNVFDYGLMLGAGAALARFAFAPLAGSRVIIVGFDDGDYLTLRDGAAAPNVSLHRPVRLVAAAAPPHS